MIDYFGDEIESGEFYYDTDVGKIREYNIGWFKESADIVDIMKIMHRESECGEEPYDTDALEELEKEVDSMTLAEFLNEIYADLEQCDPDYSWEREDYEYEKRRDKSLVG